MLSFLPPHHNSAQNSPYLRLTFKVHFGQKTNNQMQNGLDHNKAPSRNIKFEDCFITLTMKLKPAIITLG